jgi:hypothetical protein
MSEHINDWKLWRFRQNKLTKQEQNKIRIHLADYPDCTWDLTNLDVVEQLEEIDLRGKLLKLSNIESARLVSITSSKTLTG